MQVDINFSVVSNTDLRANKNRSLADLLHAKLGDMLQCVEQWLWNCNAARRTTDWRQKLHISLHLCGIYEKPPKTFRIMTTKMRICEKVWKIMFNKNKLLTLKTWSDVLIVNPLEICTAPSAVILLFLGKGMGEGLIKARAVTSLFATGWSSGLMQDFLTRTVVGCDWRFGNLCGNHL